MQTKDSPPLSPHVRTKLAALRRRIRVYVWLEGLAVALVWLGLTFWLALAIDYLPVLVGASEMPRAARAVLLVAIAGVLAYIVWRWILRRTFVRLADHSMALLLERQFDRFHDSLLTSVELAEQPDRARQFNDDMLEHTRAEADEQVRDVRLRRVFRFKPLATYASIALAFVVTVGAFAYFANDAFGIWVRRMYALKDEPWPRNAHVEVVGVEVKRELAFGAGASEEEIQRANFLTFSESRRLQVAKGSSLVLRVRADASKEVVPDTCTVYYTTYETTPEGEERRVDRGWVNMDKDGEERDGFQYYTFSAKPFKSILNSVHFDVVGFDHRVRDYRVRVVDSPAILLTEMDCIFPGYMVNREQSLWLPRTVELRSGTQLPRGTQIRFRVATNKPLKEAIVVNADTNERVGVKIAGAAADSAGSSKGSDAPLAAPEAEGSPASQKPGFEFTVDRLEGNLGLKVTLIDIDGVTNDRPIRLFVTAIEDTAPRVETALRGISSAITPDAQTPAVGRIADDYGVQAAWFEVTREGAEEPFLHRFPVPGNGEVNAALDFQLLRGQAESPYEIKEGDKLVLTVKASDFSDLDGEPNVGSGDRYQLDVVSPNQLLAMLEARELGQRRRFEQIIEEMTDMRDSLLRVKAELSGEDNRGAEPEDKTESGKPKAESEEIGEAAEPPPTVDATTEAADANQESGSSLRLLRIQRADQQASKSSQETLGVAMAFEGIREELINNRVDTEERKSRLKELIADPLRNISEKMFPELNNRLVELQKVHADPQQGPAAAQLSLDETERVLTAMNEVLNQMLDLETYNELVDIVRSIIKDQGNIIEDTRKQRRKVLFEP
jgi:hypothetical protein